MVANFNLDAGTEAEKWHCDVNAAAAGTMTQYLLPENIVGLWQHDAALLNTLRNVLGDVPKVAKGMRDKMKGTETSFEDCVSKVATNNYVEAWADIGNDMSFMGNNGRGGLQQIHSEEV